MPFPERHRPRQNTDGSAAATHVIVAWRVGASSQAAVSACPQRSVTALRSGLGKALAPVGVVAIAMTRALVRASSLSCTRDVAKGEGGTASTSATPSARSPRR